jgi:phosphoribosylformylglycinamidine synthase
LLYQVGETKNELGGSHFAFVNSLSGGQVPTVDPQRALATFAAVHRAISAGLVRACHDLSEGGLAVAAAEMAFAGGLGARIELANVPAANDAADAAARLFSESNSRFLCEVSPENQSAFEREFAGVPIAVIGEVQAEGHLFVTENDTAVVTANISDLKEAWQSPLRY